MAELVNLILAIRRCLPLLWAALIRLGLQLWCDNEDCISKCFALSCNSDLKLMLSKGLSDGYFWN